MLARARSSIADWLALADRVPPAELLDRVLADSAYEHEIARRRAAAARENLKKMRGLVRRLQNSGYLTLAASPTISTGCPPATNRTPWSTRSMP